MNCPKREMMEKIIVWCAEAPDSQVDKKYRKKFEEIANTFCALTDSELYDFLANVSKNGNIEEISSFVKTVCDMEKFYKRPQL